MPLLNYRTTKRKVVIDLLMKEYVRISDVLHKAIDNYYKVSAAILAAMAALVLIPGRASDVIVAIVPFVALYLLDIESHARTTIFCDAKYLSLIEERLNGLIGYPVLLWESRLTIGKEQYYTVNLQWWLRIAAYGGSGRHRGWVYPGAYA